MLALVFYHSILEVHFRFLPYLLPSDITLSPALCVTVSVSFYASEPFFLLDFLLSIPPPLCFCTSVRPLQTGLIRICADNTRTETT